MALTGTGLYNAIKPILDEGCTSFATFSSKMGAKISTYVAESMELAGVYVGTKPHGTPSLLVAATGKLVPTVPTPPLLAPVLDPFPGYMTWIKTTLETTIRWQIVSLPPHTNTPKVFDPTTTMIDILGDFSDLRSSEGFWSMVCDAIVCCILAYIPTTTPATATDGSSGNIAWAPVDAPTDVVHNFVFRVDYDANNLALVQWINNHITDTGDLSGTVDVPIDDQPYQSAVLLWKGLTQITKQCTFYKKQDDGALILLTTGTSI